VSFLRCDVRGESGLACCGSALVNRSKPTASSKESGLACCGCAALMCGMALPFRAIDSFFAAPPPRGCASIRDAIMMTISRDNPCLYLTVVCKDRLPVFRKDEFKELACKALNEARSSGQFLLFAYVIMPDLHLITRSFGASQSSRGIASRRRSR